MALKTGDVLEGKVVRIKPYGAFVAFEGGESGMVHISEISNSYVNDINEYLTVGQTVKVKVITVSPENVISLSIKALVPKPEPAGGRPRSSSPQGERGGYQQRGGRGGTGGSGGQQRAGGRSFQKNSPQVPVDPFEEMMNKFKRTSDDKMSDLKDVIDNRRGSKNRRSHQK